MKKYVFVSVLRWIPQKGARYVYLIEIAGARNFSLRCKCMEFRIQVLKHKRMHMYVFLLGWLCVIVLVLLGRLVRGGANLGLGGPLQYLILCTASRQDFVDNKTQVLDQVRMALASCIFKLKHDATRTTLNKTERRRKHFAITRWHSSSSHQTDLH